MEKENHLPYIQSRLTIDFTQIRSILMSEHERESVIKIKDITAGAGALGLLGYGMTGVLLGLANAGLIEVGSMILGMVIFYGGIAQFVAGLMEWKKGNTYGMVAYASYGLFWFSFGALLLLPVLGLAKSTGGAGSNCCIPCIMGYFHDHPVYWIIKNVESTPVCTWYPCPPVLPARCRGGNRDHHPYRHRWICGGHQWICGNLHRACTCPE